MSTKNKSRTRVAIIGAGSAGMSAAHALALSPDKFEVELFERSPHCGGMATSTEIDPAHGASYINDGVQGEQCLPRSDRRRACALAHQASGPSQSRSLRAQ